MIGPHLHVRRVVALPHVQAGRDVPSQLRVVPDRPGEAFGLVGGEGVHRVDEKRLDAMLAPAVVAVVEDWDEKALRLARPGARGDDGRARMRAPEPLEGLLLVQVWSEGQRNVRKEIGAALPLAKGQPDGEVGPFEQAAFRREEPIEEAVKMRRGDGKGRAEKILDALPDLCLEYGGDHRFTSSGAAPWIVGARGRSAEETLPCILQSGCGYLRY